MWVLRKLAITRRIERLMDLERGLSMKKLGLIGGTGPESTLLYYQKLVYGARARVGHDFLPRLTIESLNVFQVLECCQRKEFTRLVDYLLGGIKNLVAAGADVVTFTGVTPHIVLEQIRQYSPVPVVSIIDVVSEEAKRQKCSRVGLLGTRFTMEADFFKQPFHRAGISVVSPNCAEITYIADKITHELEVGIVNANTQAAFSDIVQRMKDEENIDSVILGCTELPLLFDGLATSVNTLDAMQYHIDALLSVMLSE